MSTTGKTRSTRLFGSILFISIILMVAFSQPWTVDRSDYSSARYYVMGVSGLLGMVIMTRQGILGIRPAFNRFSTDFFQINYRHKRLGIGTLMALIFHPVATVLAYGTSWLYVFALDFSSGFEGRVSLGKIAFDLTLIILVTSILSRKIMSFRSRHWIHLLSYPTFLAIWLHAWYTGTMISRMPAIRWYRIAIGGILVAITVLRVAYQFGYLKTKATITSHVKQTPGVYELTLAYNKTIPYEPGQFVYLQYPRGGESHPYTILACEPEKGTMRIAYKVYGKRTQELAELANTNGQEIYIDGPYGTFTHEVPTATSPIVCIAAGIGITPFYDLVQTYADTKEIKLIYLNKKNTDVTYRSDLEGHLGDDCIHILSREGTKTTENEIVGERLTSDILQKQIGHLIENASFYICGGDSVITSVKEMLIALGVHRSRIDWEPFDM